jgi:streptogramin lyase
MNAKDGSLVKVYTDPSYRLNTPFGITSDNLGHIWVTKSGNDSLTEMNAKDGSLVKVY